MDDPSAFCRENFLPPVAGLYNFWPTITSVPMWLVPLAALRAAVRARAPPSMLVWLVVLTVLFIDGTINHAVGTERAGPIDAVVLGNVQNALHAGCLAGAPLGLSVAVAAVPIAEAVAWQSQQKAVGDLMQALISPYIIGTMGYRSWGDGRSWTLFVRTCFSFVAFHGCTLVEPRLCDPQVAEFFHATANHLCIALMFGNVSFLALRLMEHGHTKRNYWQPRAGSSISQ
mmetsp:Transcript_72548/g.234455  ORF Transcript_72548/g.234455 Transcript_72548/m.234455 type:complete len:229 (-) Transcript_72548:204-890(-)